MPKIVVLRLGHRYVRDSRLTTHLYLIARAFGASSMILADVVDNRLEEAVSKVGDRWGGDFTITMGVPWKKAINEWKEKGGIVCHLTMYGENIENGDALERIKESGRDIMVVVGGQKVPGEMFQLADFNIAIGGQPHSECAALAVLLDRYFEGKELLREFRNAKIRTVPQRHGKKVLESL
jgi:tRNA (cytidine56-2'-O)-methyltransferase